MEDKKGTTDQRRAEAPEAAEQGGREMQDFELDQVSGGTIVLED